MLHPFPVTVVPDFNIQFPELQLIMPVAAAAVCGSLQVPEAPEEVELAGMAGAIQAAVLQTELTVLAAAAAQQVIPAREGMVAQVL